MSQHLLCSLDCKDKRDLLKDDVQKVREGQQAAAEQFKDALTRLRELYHFEGGDLEKTYDQLKADSVRSIQGLCRHRPQPHQASRTNLLRPVQGMGQEAKTISNQRLRDDSEVKLRETERKYDSLHAAMKRVPSMDPALTASGGVGSAGARRGGGGAARPALRLVPHGPPQPGAERMAPMMMMRAAAPAPAPNVEQGPIEVSSTVTAEAVLVGP